MAKVLSEKVLLIGWDAADWKVATPLMDAGQMPNLERLVSEGVMGNLSTLYPILSPMLWTSIATGKRAYQHGIHGFAEPDSRTGSVRPVTNLGRRCKAVWNILNQHGKRSNVVGWWPSHPAEPINGVMVSNHFQQAVAPLDKPWLMRPGTVHPADLAAKLAEYRVHPAELEPEQILPFVPKAAEVDQNKDQRLAGVAKILAETAGVHAAATALMQLTPWDFMAVYFDAIDHFCHGYMKYRAPRLDWISEQDFEHYKDVVDGAYRFHDLMLGTYMHLAGDDTTLIIVSDHGFHPDHLRPREVGNEPAGPADEHRPLGVFAMRGPGVKKDHLIFGASLLDVTPTILTLFGLPVGRDMDGKPLLSAFADPPELEYVDSWETIPGDAGRHPPDAQVDPVDAQEALKQLVELGYIDKPDEDRQKAVTSTVKELRYNLARDYMDAARFPHAIRIFDQLWDENPDESRFGVKLIQCSVALGRTAAAREAFDRLVREKKRYAEEARQKLEKLGEEWKERQPEEIKPDEQRQLTQLRRMATVNQAAFSYLHGRLLQAERQHEQALEQFRLAESVQVHNRPDLYEQMGQSLMALKRWREAEQQFLRMREIDPINPATHCGLAQCYLGLNRPRKALREATAAVGMVYHNPRAHYLCGRALQRLRRMQEAIAAFEIAVTQSPLFADAHERLAQLYIKQKVMDKAAEHQDRAFNARQQIAAYKAGGPLAEETSDGESSLSEAASLGDWGELEEPGDLPPDAIVVVSGLPRSGTSMMMQMLVAGGLPVLTDNVRQADESNPRGYYELEQAKQVGKSADWLKDASGKAVKIIAQLLPNLPPDRAYRILFMERPLGEITASQSAMLARLGRQGATLSDQQLADAYRKQIAAVRRVLVAYPDRVSVLSINYHEALADPAVIAKRVNAFLGGQLNEAAMVAAVEPSLRHQRVESVTG